MGRGDRRTKRGKIWRGSYGKTRPSNVRVNKPTRRAQPRRAQAPVTPAVEEPAPPAETPEAPEVTETSEAA